MMLRILRRLGFGLRRARLRDELQAEMEQHVEMLTRELESQGMPLDQARLRARQRFGNVLATRERSGRSWGFPTLDSFLQDVRFGVRMLVRAPGFSAVVVLSLAVGIGANTAVFSAVNGLLLRRLPLPEPDRVVSVYLSYIPTAAYETFKERSHTVDLAAFRFIGMNLEGQGSSIRLNAAGVSGNYFSVLGVSSFRGRTIQEGDNPPGRNRIVVLSHALWRSRFGADETIVGRMIRLEGTQYQVVGVMPAGFAFPNRETELWVPFNVTDPDLWGTWVQMMGRLRPGATVDQARAEIKALIPQVVATFPWPMPQGWGNWADVIPTQKRMVGDLRTKLILLMGAVGLVLLIACANVANLLQSRATSRQHEIAVRTALGAGQGRLVRQLMTESILLSLLGGLAGLALAPLGVRLVRTMIPENQLPMTGISLDVRVLVFAGIVAMLTGVICGVWPALRARRMNLDQTLRSEGHASTSRDRKRVSSSLVVIQTTVAMVLGISAGLLVRSLWVLSHEQTGFASESLMTARLTPSNSMCAPQYGPKRVNVPSACNAFYDSLLENVSAYPGVESAAFTDVVPFGDLMNTVLAVDGNPQYSASSPYQLFVFNVGPNYFRTLGTHVVMGRDFNDGDRQGSPAVVILTRNAAEHMWPGQNPIGKRVRPSWMQEWRTVVGVVDDIRLYGVQPGAWANPTLGAVYYPARQGMVAPPKDLNLVVRTSEPAQLAAALPQIVSHVNPAVPVSQIETMQELISDSISAPRSTTWLFTAFSAIALLLGAIGTYSLISYSVASRTHEIGIRMALGAERGRVLFDTLRQGLTLTLLGTAIGAAAALGTGRLLRGMLYHVQPTDVRTFALVASVLLVSGIVAAYVPARRAASVDPLSALRRE
jgi:putative ABC transport system permease protein